jgi:hypothetical protein
MYGNDTFARYIRDYLVLFPAAKPSEMDLIAPRPKK